MASFDPAKAMATMVEESASVIASLTPSSAAVVRHILANFSEELLSSEETAAAFLEEALSERSVSSAKLAAAQAFVARAEKFSTLADFGVIEDSQYAAFVKAAQLSLIRETIAQSLKSGDTSDAGAIRAFAAHCNLAIAAKGRLSANLVNLAKEYGVPGRANLAEIDVLQVQAHARLLGIAIKATVS